MQGATRQNELALAEMPKGSVQHAFPVIMINGLSPHTNTLNSGPPRDASSKHMREVKSSGFTIVMRRPEER